MNSSDNGSRTFDLTELSDKLYVGSLRFRWIANLVAVFFFGAFAAVSVFFAVRSSLAGYFSTYGAASLVLAAFFGTLAFLIYWSANSLLRHPATALDIGSKGVVIHYPGNRRKLLSWGNRRFSLKIGTMNYPESNFSFRSARFLWSPRLCMTDEAAEALIASARSHGMSVQTVKDPNSVTGTGVLIRSAREV